MEGLNIEQIISLVASLILTSAAVYLVRFQRREIQASTVNHNVAISQKSVETMEAVISQLRKQIDELDIELLKTQQEVAKLRRDMAHQEADHAETVNALNKRVQGLEGQLTLEQTRRERVEEENVRLSKKLEERLVAIG